MKHFKYSIFLISISCMVLLNCKQLKPDNKPTTSIEKKLYQQIIFADKNQAAEIISKDNTEQFFERINTIDMSIQLKKDFDKNLNKKKILDEYKESLKNGVLDFTDNEKDFVRNIFVDAIRLCNNLSSSVFPKSIHLIKSDGNRYGPSVYYTRENAIIIPQNVLKEQNPQRFLSTMLHEIFHIYSRYNPEKRKALYELIGFKKAASKIKYNSFTMERYLTNPDGIDFDYLIDLETKKGEKVQAIPLIYSNKDSYNPEITTFFAYVSFGLIEVKFKNGTYWIPEDNRPNDVTQYTNFYTQIGENTGYIIHPDEILADNFIYLAKATENPASLKEYKSQEVLMQIKKILTE